MVPSKLKVTELRAELGARGLDTKGNKAVLVKRLEKALEQEEDGGSEDESQAQDEGDASFQEQNETTQGGLETTQQEVVDPEPAQPAPVTPEKQREPSPEKSPVKETVPEQFPEKLSPEKISPEKIPPEKISPEKTIPERLSPEKLSPAKQSPAKSSPLKSPQVEEPVENQPDSRDDVEQPMEEERQSVEPQEAEPVQQDEEEEEKPKKSQSPRKRNSERHSYHMDVDEEAQPPGVDEEEEGSEPKIKDENIDDADDAKREIKSENGVKEGYEESIKSEVKDEEDIKTEHDHDRKDSHDVKESRKRRRSSRSPSQERGRGYHDREPEIKENEVTLSWYDSDLNLTIDDKNFFSATPMSHGGFGYVWAGVRGTHGYTSGSVCYQVKVTEFSDVSHLEDEPNPNVLRVGWSIFSTSLQLGEEPFSYGYGGTGKFSVDCKFSDYGKSFGLNDVITCYLEFTNDEAILSYGVNDEYTGVAYRIPLESLEGRPLAPHILTKNAAFSVNFGQEDVPWAQVQTNFTFLRNIPVEEATPGPRRPEKRSDCEMIMMCGLPACGKTVWANQYAAEHPEKNYNILGTNALIDKMKVMGLPRKANYHGRWDVLIEKCTKCLQQLMDVGSNRRRNYILDQTNVYPAAQRRKMRNFEGFTRKAVVIVPTDEEFKSRTEKQANEEKKDVPESAVLEMKANFTLPDKDVFDEVIYVELQEEEAQALIQKYAKEANELGYVKKTPHGGFGPAHKRFRGGDFHQRNDFRSRDRFNPPGPPGGFRRGPDRVGQRSGGGGGWGGPRGGGGSMDRWRDNRNQGGFGRPPAGDRPGWRGPSSGPPGNNRGPRDYDRGGPPRGGGGGFDRNNRGGPRSGFNNRDFNRDQRGPGGPRGGPGDKTRQDAGKYTGGGAGAASTASQWGNQWGNQAQAGAGGQQAAANQGAWNQQAQWNNQAWSNYQQQWKGYQQGYNQQGYGQQGYNQPYNWQQYYGYNQQGGWGQQQNSDGSYSYPQNWQNWYAAQSAGQTSTAQPPAATK